MDRKKTPPAAKPTQERAIWRGSISFGLVQIPVGLHRADADNELHFTMLDKRDHAPVKFERKSSVTGKALDWKDIVKGFEISKGEYVVVTDDDFKQANVAASGGIDITAFVDADDIDAAYFVKPYYLLPQGRADKTYALLREALRRSGKVGVATIVLRTRQHLALVRAQGQALMLELLRFAHELRPADELALPQGGKAAGLTAREVDMALSLVESMAAPWRPEDYCDAYHDDLLALIERKRRNDGTQRAAPTKKAASSAKVVDIVTLLQQSVRATQTPRAKASARKTPPAKRAASGKARSKPAAKRRAGGRSAGKR